MKRRVTHQPTYRERRLTATELPARLRALDTLASVELRTSLP
jgi:hypothetical protein